jgi:hypothetical protein
MRITSHAPLMYAAMVAAALGTLGISGTFVYLMQREGRATAIVYVVMAPFLLMGTFLAWFGGRGLVRAALHGGWQLDLPDGGGVLGQPLRATLIPSRERRPDGEITCRLRCARRTGGGKQRAQITTLWETIWTTQTALIHPRQGLQLTVPMPASGEPTALDRHGGGIFWQLNVAIPSSGATDEQVFDLPVSRFGASTGPREPLHTERVVSKEPGARRVETS